MLCQQSKVLATRNGLYAGEVITFEGMAFEILKATGTG